MKHTYQLVLCILALSFTHQAKAQEVTSLKQFITAFDKAKRSYKPSEKQKMLNFYARTYTGEVIFFPIEGSP